MQAQGEGGGTTRRDERALRRQLRRYAVRFNDAFWRFWDAAVAPGLPPRPVVADVGPGPGLFLRDLSARLPGASLHGLDANEAMIESAAALDYAGPVPSLRLMDAEAQPLPFADGEVDLLTMTAVLHTFVDPFSFLRGQAARVIGANGRILTGSAFRCATTSRCEWSSRASRRRRVTNGRWISSGCTTSTRWTIGGGSSRSRACALRRRRRRRIPTRMRGSCGRGRSRGALRPGSSTSPAPFAARKRPHPPLPIETFA